MSNTDSEKEIGGWGTYSAEARADAKESLKAWRDKAGLFQKGNDIGFKVGNNYSKVYTEEEKEDIVAAVAQRISEANVSTIVAIEQLLSEGNIPGKKPGCIKHIIYRWGLKNPVYREMLKEARRERAYCIAENIQDLDKQAIEVELKNIDPKIANAFATLHKTRTGNMQWVAERLCPEDFSQKMQVSGKIEHTMVTVNIIAPSEKSTKIHNISDEACLVK